ncbi:MAG: Cys-tRNA(Pro) deacylase [Peptostreptococcales bacterium]|jgi:Cys-tRNA(Pro)/Cys-tRNA(Cys) deacylase
MTKKIKKTNAMRSLDQEKVNYTCYEYDDSDNMIDGITVANMIGKDPSLVFKTLVTTSNSHAHYVFVLPVDKELDLKKAAKVVEEKKIELIPVKDIEKTTGYIKGGCSPIGMKKRFVTIFHESALQYKRIICNGGKVGIQIEIDPKLLENICPCRFADICMEEQ